MKYSINPWSCFFCTTFHLFEPYPLKHGYHGFRLLAGIEPRNMQIYRCPLGDFMIKTWGLMVILMDMLGTFFKHMVKFYMLHILAYFGYLRTQTIFMFWSIRIGTKQKKHAGRGDTNQTRQFLRPCVFGKHFRSIPILGNGLAQDGRPVEWSGGTLSKSDLTISPNTSLPQPTFFEDPWPWKFDTETWEVLRGECEDDCSILTCTSDCTLQNIERWLIVLGVVILILLCPCPFCC